MKYKSTYQQKQMYFQYCDGKMGLEFWGSLLFSFLPASGANQKVQRDLIQSARATLPLGSSLSQMQNEEF